MWTADRRRRPPPRREAGFTILETVIVVSLVALMSIVVTGTIHSARQAGDYLEGVRIAAERSQKVLGEVIDLVSTSRKMFDADEDGVGAGYLAALATTRDPPLPALRLPVIDLENPLGPDDALFPLTGNALLFVAESSPASAVSVAASKKVRSIDVYRFVAIYPRQTTAILVAGHPAARDLVLWRSRPYPSYPQVLDVSDETQRRSVVRDLYRRYGYRYLWDPQAPVAEAFYAIDEMGNISGTPHASFRIEEDPVLSERGRLVYAGVQLARTDPADATRRVVMGVDSPSVWTPDGFEVKISGAAVSRQVWIRLVVEARAVAGQDAVAQAATAIVAIRDL